MKNQNPSGLLKYKNLIVWGGCVYEYMKIKVKQNKMETVAKGLHVILMYYLSVWVLSVFSHKSRDYFFN